MVIGWAAAGGSRPKGKRAGGEAAFRSRRCCPPGAQASVLGEDVPYHPPARPPARQPGWRARFLRESRPCT